MRLAIYIQLGLLYRLALGDMSNTQRPRLPLSIQGVAYSPVPSDDQPAPPTKYFDTDFTNDSFPMLWSAAGEGRADVANLAGIGVNFLHLYDWSVPPAPGLPPGQYQRNHLPFLKECDKQKVRVFVPVSNYFLEQIHQGSELVQGQIKAMVTEVYDGQSTPRASAAIWGIGNEYDLASTFTVNDVVTAMTYLVAAETALGITAANALPVTAPVSFAAGTLPPGIAAIQTLQTAVEANASLGPTFWNQRFVASTNPFNDGAFLKTYIDTTFPHYFADLPFFFAEMGFPIQSQGVTNEEQQAAFVLEQLNATKPRNAFLGRCVFQFLNQTAMKSGTEATFGMTKYAPAPPSPRTGTIPAGYVPGGGSTYNVDTLTQKPLYQSVKSAYSKS